jgi:hypothetical protein
MHWKDASLGTRNVLGYLGLSAGEWRGIPAASTLLVPQVPGAWSRLRQVPPGTSSSVPWGTAPQCPLPPRAGSGWSPATDAELSVQMFVRKGGGSWSGQRERSAFIQP